MFVERVGKLPRRFHPHATKQVKAKHRVFEPRYGVVIKLHSQERLAIGRLLNCESARAALGFLLGHPITLHLKPRPAHTAHTVDFSSERSEGNDAKPTANLRTLLCDA